MAKKSKKSPPRKAAAKRKPKAKAVKPAKTKRAKRAAASRKRVVRRKTAPKPESTLERIENAIGVGAAEFDDVALSLGLLAAPLAPRKGRKKK